MSSQQKPGRMVGDTIGSTHFARRIVNHLLLLAVALWAITVMLGSVLVLGADFGLPIWTLIPGLLWLATVGLPTITGVLLAASFWGAVPGLHGLGAFLCCGASLGLTLEIVCCVCLSRCWGHRVNP